MPRTSLGRWTVGLTVFALIFFALLRPLLTIVPSLVLRGSQVPIATLLVLVAGSLFIAAPIVGALAVTRSRERSIAVYLATLFGLLASYFFLGNLLTTPH